MPSCFIELVHDIGMAVVTPCMLAKSTNLTHLILILMVIGTLLVSLIVLAQMLLIEQHTQIFSHRMAVHLGCSTTSTVD